ncbi:MAG TPA: phage tail tape measure protein [Dysgonamonadaceae bacterium]|nr:phage tail tape measure protein [Dysgonamonadaceae bacterium]
MAKTILDEQMRLTVVINGNEAQKELYDLEKRNRELNASTKALREEKSKLAAQGKKNTEEYKNITAEIKKNTTEVKANKARMGELQKQLGVTGLTMRQLKSRASELRLQLQNMVPGSAQYKKLEAELKQVNTQIQKVSLNSRAAESSLSRLGNTFNKFAALGAATIAVLTGIVLSMQKMIDYNGKLSDAQADVQKTTGLSAEAVDELSKSFGLMKTRTARIELLELAEEAGRLGKDSVKDVQEFVNVANKLKVALGDELSTTQIREVGKMAEVYKVATKNGLSYGDALEALGSSINEVSASGANQASFLVDYLKRQAGISIQTNVSAQDNIGYAATFDELGQSVEVAATAMNKVWMDMFQNTDEYAKIAGMSIKDFTILMNTDANAAMLKFLKGLNGNNEGLSVLGERLQDLEVGGARGVQALAALSANTELLEKRQETANKALEEGTSLANEYEIKNNNLAATIAKVERAIYGAFSSKFLVNTLASLIGGFGKLIGVIEDAETAFKNETKATGESARSSLKLANESEKLLKRYEELKTDGVEPTTEAKIEMDYITMKLRDSLGESVIAINEETGALELNTSAVKDQITLKRIAADEEASTLISRKKGVDESLADLFVLQQQRQAEYDIAKKGFEQQHQHDLQVIRSSRSINAMEKQQMIERLDGYKLMDNALSKLQQVEKKMDNQRIKSIDIMKELASLDYDQSHVNAFFKTSTPVKGDKEGDTQVLDGVTYVFKGGKWVPVTYTPRAATDKENAAAQKRADQLKKEAAELLKLERELEDNRLSMIQDAFKREMQINDQNFSRKQQDIELKIEENQKTYDKATLANDTDLASKMLAQNAELFNLWDQQEQLHQSKRNEILQSGIEKHVKTIEERFNREEQLLEIAHNNEMALLGNNDRAKKELQNQYDKDKLERQKLAAEALMQEIQTILSENEFEGFDLEFLTEDQKNALVARLQEVGFSLSEINKLLAALQGGKDDPLGLGNTDDVDVLGFTKEQWLQMISNSDSFAESLGKIGFALQGVAEAYSLYDQFASQNEARKLQRIDQNFQREKDKQDALLRNKFISEKQHKDAVEGLEKEANKKKAEIEYKQAKREKEMNIVSILGNTAVAVSKALAQGGFVLGVPWAGIVAGLGALQLALAIRQPLPAKGFESGYYPVRREQDGKLFNASFGGESRSGVVDKPTVFLAGEGGKNFPEMIIDGRTLKQFDPELKNSLYRELGRIKGFEDGYYKNDQYQVPAETKDNGYTALAIALNRNSDILERLEENGIIAYMSKDLANIKKMRDELERLQKIENKAKINT